jgi:predicted metal-dependent hydrolase
MVGISAMGRRYSTLKLKKNKKNLGSNLLNTTDLSYNLLSELHAS